VHLRFLWRPRLKDPADEMVLETAVNGGADRLVTFNMRHLARLLASSGFACSCRVMRGRRYNDEMRKSNVALRLQVSLLDEARRVTEAEGVALNQFINVAVAENCRPSEPGSTSVSARNEAMWEEPSGYSSGPDEGTLRAGDEVD